MTLPQLCIGIDIGKRRHVAGFVSSSLLSQYGRFDLCPTATFEANAAGIEGVLTHIQEYLPLSACAVLLEHTGHYHRTLEELLIARGLSVYVIAVHQRKSRLDKTDKIDALRLANTLYAQLVLGVQEADPANRIHLQHPPSQVASELNYLVRRRFELVQDISRHRNRLTAIADELFPELTQVFADPNREIALLIREHFPTPAELAAASLQELQPLKRGRQPGDAKLLRLLELAKTSIGITNTHRQQGLILEQRQLIDELRLLERHVDSLERDITHVVEGSREGQILLSFGIIGPMQAAALISAIGTIDNFASAAKLKKFFGWAPQSTQTGITLDRVALTKTGTRISKQTMFMVALRTSQADTEWKRLYERLVPLKCAFDPRRKTYRGRMRVVGRVAGEITERIYLLLRRDADLVASTPSGQQPPAPELYDPEYRRS